LKLEPTKARLSHHGGKAMTEQVKGSSNGVVCLYCGKKMAITAPARRAVAAGAGTSSGSRVSIVRCSACGKEASYLPSEIVNLENLPVAS
jgi:hypothetical protein